MNMIGLPQARNASKVSMLLLCYFGVCNSLFEESFHVHSLNFTSFAAAIQQSSNPWLIDFYAPWCPHCIAFSPHYDRIGASLASSNVTVGAVNCELDEAICDEYKVEIYPSIRLFHVTKGSNDSESVQFHGIPGFETVFRWLKEQMKDANMDVGVLTSVIADENPMLETNLERPHRGNIRVGGQAEDISLGLAAMKYHQLSEAGGAALYALEHSLFRGHHELSGERYSAAKDLVGALMNTFALRQNRLLFQELFAILKRQSVWSKAEWKATAVQWKLMGKDHIFPRAMFDVEDILAHANDQGRVDLELCTTYTCTLWTLFHTMTVGVRNKDCKLKPSRVAAAIRGFVKHFFGCEECVQHFLANNPEDVIASLAKKDQDGGEALIVWLWDMHNKVNIATGKAIWPSNNACSICFKQSPSQNASESVPAKIMSYVVATYSQSGSSVFKMQLAGEGIVEAAKGYVSSNLSFSIFVFALLLGSIMMCYYIRDKQPKRYQLWKQRQHQA